MNRTLVRLVALLAALVGVAWFTGVFDTNPSTIQAPDMRVDADQVARLELSRDSLSVSVLRQDGVWRVVRAGSGGAPRAELPLDSAPRADSGTVARTLEKLATAEVRSTVTRSPERWDRFGVGSGALRLDAMTSAEPGADPAWTFFISETGPDFSSSYVRIGGDDRVFSVSPRLFVDPTEDRWRDKRIVRIEPDAVERIEATHGADSFVLTRSGEGWTIAAAGATGPASLVPANRLASALNPLTADGFYSAPPGEDLPGEDLPGEDLPGENAAGEDAPDTRRLEVTAGGETYVFEFVSREGGYALTLDREPGVTWKVFATRLHSLFPDPETLRAQ